jgi:hypothetical protein
MGWRAKADFPAARGFCCSSAIGRLGEPASQGLAERIRFQALAWWRAPAVLPAIFFVARVRQLIAH